MNSDLNYVFLFQEPVLFLKPTSSYLKNGGTIQIPHNEGSLHHEVELAVVIGKKARDVPESSAMDFVAGIPSYCLTFNCCFLCLSLVPYSQVKIVLFTRFRRSNTSLLCWPHVTCSFLFVKSLLLLLLLLQWASKVKICILVYQVMHWHWIWLPGTFNLLLR